MRALVARGLGASVVPRSLLAAAGAEVAARPVAPAPLARPLALAWRSGRRRAAAAEAFLAFARERASGAVSDGALGVVLHTHMPYVEGYGTWPFGEEWLWEAIATCYLPLLDVLDDWPGRVTLSLTPVLLDQLEAPGALARCLRFLEDVRAETHRRDLAWAREPGVAAALEHSRERYAAAAAALRARGSLVEAFARHAAWTSAATHAVLPLLATDGGVRLQLASGVAAHRARFGRWGGGLWLPECAYAPWLDRLLAEAGVRVTVVELPGRRRPLRSPAGPLLVPFDRALVDLAWSAGGYPAAAAYRDSHRFTPLRHRAWAVDGAPYDPARAARQVAADADDFVARARERGGAVFAVDTEFLGHFWHEGADWLRAVLERADATGLPVVPLGADVDADVAPGDVRAPHGLPVSSWGRGRDLRTWSAPPAGGLAWIARAAELRAAAADAVPARALRELLALQASDWAFLATEGTAGRYPLERAAGHARAFEAALAGGDEGPARATSRRTSPPRRSARPETCSTSGAAPATTCGRWRASPARAGVPSASTRARRCRGRPPADRRRRRCRRAVRADAAALPLAGESFDAVRGSRRAARATARSPRRSTSRARPSRPTSGRSTARSTSARASGSATCSRPRTRRSRAGLRSDRAFTRHLGPNTAFRTAFLRPGTEVLGKAVPSIVRRRSTQSAESPPSGGGERGTQRDRERSQGRIAAKSAA